MRRPSSAGLGLVSLVVVVSFCGLAPYAIHGYRFPIGADAPVYIWWARLAGHDGLSAVGGRPGVPALTLLLANLTGSSAGTVVAALEIAFTAAAASAALALVTFGANEDRPLAPGARWYAGALVGLFALHLAVGYLATLALAACFLGALALLLRGTRGATAGAAVLLAAGVLAHPTLAPLALGVLGLTATLAWHARPTADNAQPFLGSEHGRYIVATGAALVAAAVALVALLSGPGPLPVDTSRDDFLARAGLGWMLPGLFRARLVEHAASYAPFVTLPLAVIGGGAATEALGRLLRAWAIVLVVGVVAGYVTGVFPAERVVSFAFVIPIAAGIGLAVIAEAIRDRARAAGRSGWGRLAPVAIVAALGAIAIPAAHLWLSTPPELFPLETTRVREAAGSVEAPPGTPLVVIVSGRQPVASFFATEAGNAIRASVPADRIRDVRVLVPGGRERTPSAENDRLVAQTRADAATGGPVVVLDLAPFDRTGFGQVRARGALPTGLPVPTAAGTGVALAQPGVPGTAAPSPPADPWPGADSFADLVLITFVVMAALTTAGVGWARWCIGPGHAVEAAALAPVLGAAAMILLGVAADRVGLGIGGAGTAWGVWIAATAAGSGLAWRTRRRPARSAAPAVSPGPAVSAVRPRV